MFLEARSTHAVASVVSWWRIDVDLIELEFMLIARSSQQIQVISLPSRELGIAKSLMPRRSFPGGGKEHDSKLVQTVLRSLAGSGHGAGLFGAGPRPGST